MIRNKYMVLGMTFMSLGLLGALISAIGASLPPIQKFFGVDISEVGSVTTYYQLSYAFFCFFGGLLTDFFGKNRVLALGGFLYGICTLALGMFGDFSSTLVLFTVIGIGGGLFFIGANTMIVQLFPDQRGKYLNLLHLCFAVGSVIASLMVSGFVSAGFKWNRVFQILGSLALTVGILFIFTKAGSPSSTPGPGLFKGLLAKYKQMFGNKLFLSVLISNTLAIGAQFGTIYLLVLFLSTVRGLPVPQPVWCWRFSSCSRDGAYHRQLLIFQNTYYDHRFVPAGLSFRRPGRRMDYPGLAFGDPSRPHGPRLFRSHAQPHRFSQPSVT